MCVDIIGAIFALPGGALVWIASWFFALGERIDPDPDVDEDGFLKHPDKKGRR